MASIITVKSGDTLTSIAKRAGMDVRDLIAQNPQFADPNMIRPGDTVFASGKASSPKERQDAANKMIAHAQVALPSDPQYMQKQGAYYQAAAANQQDFVSFVLQGGVVPNIAPDAKVTPQVLDIPHDVGRRPAGWQPPKAAEPTIVGGPGPGLSNYLPGGAGGSVLATEQGQGFFSLRHRLANIPAQQTYNPQAIQSTPPDLARQQLEAVTGYGQPTLTATEIAQANAQAQGEGQQWRLGVSSPPGALSNFAIDEGMKLAQWLKDNSATFERIANSLKPGGSFWQPVPPPTFEQDRNLRMQQEESQARTEQNIQYAYAKALEAEGGAGLTWSQQWQTGILQWMAPFLAGEASGRPSGETADGGRTPAENQAAMGITSLALWNAYDPNMNIWEYGGSPEYAGHLMRSGPHAGEYWAPQPNLYNGLATVVSERAANGALIQPKGSSLKAFFKEMWGVEGFDSVQSFMNALGYDWNPNEIDPISGEATGAWVKKGSVGPPVDSSGTSYVYGGAQLYPYTPSPYVPYTYGNNNGNGYGAPFMSVLWRISA